MKNEIRQFMLAIFTSASFTSRPYRDADAVAQDYLAFVDGRSTYYPDVWRIACAELCG